MLLLKGMCIMKKLILILLCTVLTCSFAFADNDSEHNNIKSNQGYNTKAEDYSSYQFDAKSLKNSIVTVPAGLTFKGVFLSPVSSETATLGQEVSLALTSDFYCKDKRVAPAGSVVSGNIIEVSKAKHGSLNGKLMMRFTHIITPSGLDIPISAVVRTPDKTGVILGGSELMYTVGSSSVPEAASAKSYTIPYQGVRAGTAAAMATAVETGGGSLLKSIWDKGEDVDISANTVVELILTQPITVTPTDN